MFTGLQEKTAQQRAQGLGVKEYLLKAKYSIPELLEMVRKHVPPGKGPERWQIRAFSSRRIGVSWRVCALFRTSLANIDWEPSGNGIALIVGEISKNG